jgi:hypothetical protein
MKMLTFFAPVSCNFHVHIHIHPHKDMYGNSHVFRTFLVVLRLACTYTYTHTNICMEILMFFAPVSLATCMYIYIYTHSKICMKILTFLAAVSASCALQNTKETTPAANTKYIICVCENAVCSQVVCMCIYTRGGKHYTVCKKNGAYVNIYEKDVCVS